MQVRADRRCEPPGLSCQTIDKEPGRLVEEGAIDIRCKRIRIRIVDAEPLARIAAGT